MYETNMMSKGNQTRKVVINSDFGGFALSKRAESLYEELSGKEIEYVSDIPRDDVHLVQVVEQLSSEASGDYSSLQVVEVVGPYRIQEYDGKEWIETSRDIDWQ